ncbi:MAG: hypothetical protein IPP82_01405 [Xanthomonadales bacterium]|nr:hypothetical protein [Xanthomonadales bacterium]
MEQRNQRASSSGFGRICGAIVVLATLSSAALMILYLLKPWLFLQPWMFPPGHPGLYLRWALAASFLVSGVGSLCMLAITKKLWWFFGVLVVGLSAGLLTIIGMGFQPG